MKLNSPGLRKAELYFSPSDVSVQSSWRLNYGGSMFLFAEGPSMTSGAGYDLFVMLANGREIEKKQDGTFFVKALQTQ